MAFSSNFFVSHCLFCLVNFARRTTIIEDTHLTLAVIPFKAKANNSLIFSPVQTYENKFPVQSIIPCWMAIRYPFYKKLAASQKLPRLFVECSIKSFRFKFVNWILTYLVITGTCASRELSSLSWTCFAVYIDASIIDLI